MDKKSNLYKIRHSAAHILAQAVCELYDNVNLAVGPVTENGFFYDLQCPTSISESDLEKIESRMKDIVKRDLAITGKLVTKDEARDRYPNNPFKKEIIDRIDADKVSIYSQGEFFDLCEGNHTESTKEVQHFKLMAVSGSYWKGSAENESLQRISGVAFENRKDLKCYLNMLEEAKKYDHRVIGKNLDLFSFSPEAQGMAFFHPKGTFIFNKLQEYARELQDKYGYQEIKTPQVLKQDLWKTSGHYDNFKENMFFASAGDNEKWAVRPMNCPCGILVYKNKQHSYRDLPLRYAEFGLVHRYELSGVLHGLCRVRSFTQDDAHIFCTQDQMLYEIEDTLAMAEELYKKFEFNDIKMVLSTRPEKYIGSIELWDQATDVLAKAMESRGYKVEINEGEGAFYGPKIEILISDAIGRQWQCGTVQVDFFLPENFGLYYVDSDQSRKTPVMIHRAVYGSFERFLGILLEHYKGILPLWLAPVQARILTITSEQLEYAKKIQETLQSKGVRVELDQSGDKISAQIKRAQLEKIPRMIILGAKEAESETVALRTLDGKQQFGLKVENLF